MNHEAQFVGPEGRKMVAHGVCRGLAGVFASSSGVAKEKFVINARPHPGPLPQGEGEATRVSRKSNPHNCSRRLSAARSKAVTTCCDVPIVNNRRMILPLLGERAGVRASVTTNSLSAFQNFLND